MRLADDRALLLFRIAFWAALIFSFVMATLPHPPELPREIGDKYQHMAAFATMTLLAGLGYRDVPLPRIVERLSFFGAMIELVQSIPALGRDCDILDWVADTAAIIIVALIAHRLRRSMA